LDHGSGGADQENQSFPAAVIKSVNEDGNSLVNQALLWGDAYRLEIISAISIPSKRVWSTFTTSLVQQIYRFCRALINSELHKG